jgi:hypothetical protein
MVRDYLALRTEAAVVRECSGTYLDRHADRWGDGGTA